MFKKMFYVNQSEREEICNALWDTEGWDMKTAYLSERVKQVPISRKRIRKETKSEKRRTRNNMIRYSLVKSAKEEVVVCQKFFLATLNISEGRVKYCLQHKKTETNATISDKRGRSNGCTYNRVDPSREESIIEHIQSFPTVESLC